MTANFVHLISIVKRANSYTNFHSDGQFCTLNFDSEKGQFVHLISIVTANFVHLISIVKSDGQCCTLNFDSEKRRMGVWWWYHTTMAYMTIVHTTTIQLLGNYAMVSTVWYHRAVHD